MQKGGLERRRASPLIGVEILGCRPRRGLLMSDRALSQATARAAAIRHSVGGILRCPVFQSLLRRQLVVLHWRECRMVVTRPAVRRWGAYRLEQEDSEVLRCDRRPLWCGLLWFHRDGIRV